MTLLSEYYVPGLHIEDRSIKVPLDWTGHEPGHGFDGESISLFYRVVTAPEHVHDDLPLLVFLQGGPGGSGPRPLGPSSDGWIEEHAMREAGAEMKNREGYANGGWILLDYYDIIIHVFSEKERSFYDLDNIWRDGELLRLGEY